MSDLAENNPNDASGLLAAVPAMGLDIDFSRLDAEIRAPETGLLAEYAEAAGMIGPAEPMAEPVAEKPEEKLDNTPSFAPAAGLAPRM